MNPEPIVEYRCVWPNGNLVDAIPPSEDKEKFFHFFDNYQDTLKRDGVPKEYRPVVEARIVERTEHHWKSYGEIQHELKLRQEEARRPKHVVSPEMPVPPSSQVPGHHLDTWGAPTAEQVARVRAKQFGFHDPCVICGTRFLDCPHDSYSTEAFVKMVKARYGG